MTRQCRVAVTSLVLTLALAAPALADINGVVKREGSLVRLTAADLVDTPGGLPRSPGSGPYYEHRFDSVCDRTAAGEAQCAASIVACASSGGPGPLSHVFRRTMNADGTVRDGWQFRGTTCFPSPSGTTPALTYAMIREAFRLTRWAQPRIATQPEGDVTLVNLDTYYRIEWSEDGFAPGEVDAVDPSRMLGHRVEIRPRVEHFVYRFGDGTGFGPTPYEGGVYPTGPITHRYAAPGVHAALVEVTWTADFRVDHGPWTPIPETVTLTGPPTPVTVRTARGVLVGR